MGYKVSVFCVGKAHLSEYNGAILGYEKRLKGKCTINWIYCKNDRELIKKLAKKEYICFDVLGKAYSSKQFSKLFEHELSLNFVIGGAEGIPEQIKENSTMLISFSKFTFPHQMIRLMVSEQIYRSLEILKGSNYDK